MRACVQVVEHPSGRDHTNSTLRVIKANGRETEGETEETVEEWDSTDLGRVLEKKHGQNTLYEIHE